jgi:DNA-binding NarL/FixJ family response regulator
MIKLLLVDDEVLIRQGMASLLSLHDDFQVVGQAANGEEALEISKKVKPDVVLMDIQMPVLGGVEATRRLLDSLPNVKVLVLTTYDTEEYIVDAVRNGASGYLLKDSGSDQIAAAVRAVHGGFMSLSPGVSEKLMANIGGLQGAGPPKAKLTAREREVLELLRQGRSNGEIAAALNITDRTVREHISHILEQLDLRDRTQAALWAQENL